MDNSMAIAYMSLFPNSTELCLSGMKFYSDGFATGLDELARFLCGRKLRVLSFCDGTHVAKSSNFTERQTFDLTALEELRIVDCPELVNDTEFVPQLLQASRPTALKSLAFVGRFDPETRNTVPCSLQTMESVLFITSPCLVNLSLTWDFYVWDTTELMDILNRLPEFPALNTLSLVLNEPTEELLHALPATPRLTTLHLRIVFVHEDDYYSREYFTRIIHRVFPWGGQSMRRSLTQKFPLLQRTERGLRRRMERELVDRLQNTGADLAEYLDVRWLDSEYRPVVYSKTNGKPRWKFPPDCFEPETEESDCESDSDY
ncbi:hypothetical protein B0H14DRAFT_2870954 [Mycena olivaceomarginata]|nr:hypothetical protein B0H14DRAFT_2870954 [Mycena olivaceomarginata]